MGLRHFVGGGGSTTITFPKAFPKECFNVVATPVASPNTGLAYTVQVEAVSSDNVLVSGNRDDGGGIVERAANDHILAGHRALRFSGAHLPLGALRAMRRDRDRRCATERARSEIWLPSREGKGSVVLDSSVKVLSPLSDDRADHVVVASGAPSHEYFRVTASAEFRS